MDDTDMCIIIQLQNIQTIYCHADVNYYLMPLIRGISTILKSPFLRQGI